MTKTARHPLTISVVTPSYNQGCYLSETIKSVLGQEGDFRLDYIVADGGSTDDSVAVIRHYQKMLEEGAWPLRCQGISFRWLSERDNGQSDAIMKGFAMAEGEVWAWLNSDDSYLPGALDTAARAFGEEPELGLFYGDAYYSTEAGTLVKRDRSDHFDLEKLACFNIICQPSAFFRAEVFREVGGLDRSLRYSMDFDLWIRIGKRFSCRYLPKSLSVYRLHEASKTMLDETLLANGEEALQVAIGQLGWAPLTRVYNCCSLYCKERLPRLLSERRFALVVSSVVCSIYRWLMLNKRVSWRDLRLLTPENFRKLFRSRMENMTGSRGH